MKNLQKPDPNDFERALVERSSRYGPNVLDWLRSVYFSLMGSTLLTLSLKANGVSHLAVLLMFIAFVFFSLGLICSLKIANRYKKYEKAYDSLSAKAKGNLMDNDYYIKQELDRHKLLVGKEKTSWVLRDHVVTYCIWVMALVAVVGAGFKIESDIDLSSEKNKARLEKLDFGIEDLKKSNTGQVELIAKIKTLSDSLFLLKGKLNDKDSELTKLDNRIKKARNRGCKL